MNVGALHAAAVSALGGLVALVGAPPLEEQRYRRPSVSDLDLARFAAAFVDELSRGTRAPLRALAERFHLSYHTAVDRRRSCVTRGLLTGTSQGRAQGSLTDRARGILAQAR